MSGVDLGLIASLPRDEAGPVFAAPWHAQVFAMAVRLCEQGHFTWREWAETLGDRIKAAPQRGDEAANDAYWRQWLAALERLSIAKGLTSAAELDTRKADWDRAARATPHGRPIVLDRG